MYAIKDLNSAGRVIMWVKKEPKFLPKTQYTFIADEDYIQLKNATFWIDDDNNITFKKPYSFTYHTLINGEWKLDHDKVNSFVLSAKKIFVDNIHKYKQYGLDDKRFNLLLKQIEFIKTLDDVEEFILIYLGGKYEVIYNHRFSMRV